MSQPTPAALFFDAGNTLLTMDYRYLAARLEGRPGTPAERAPVDPVALGRAEVAARPDLSRFLAGDRSTESGLVRETYLRLILSRLDWPETALTGEALADLVEWLSRVDVADRVWSHVDARTPAVLEALRARGLALAVVSNSDGEIDRRLDEAGLRPYFDAVIDSGRLGIEKPHPGIFHAAADAVGVSIERCLHVGDIYHVDVVGAETAGAVGILLDPGRSEAFDCPQIALLEDLMAFLPGADSSRPVR